MLLSITVKEGLTEHLHLTDGSYLVRIIPIKDKSVKAFQEEYFAIIDEATQHTGNSRYSLHEAFKAEINIQSITKLKIEEWPSIIEQLKFYLLMATENNF